MTPEKRGRWERAAVGLDGASRTLARVLSFGAVLSLVVTTALLAVSSLLRYAADQPIYFTDELVGFLLVSTAFLAVADGYYNGRQIRLLFVWKLLPRRARIVTRLLGETLSLFVLAIIVRETWAFAEFSREIGAKSPVAGIYEWPFMMIIPVAIGVLMLSVAVDILRRVSSLQFDFEDSAESDLT